MNGHIPLGDRIIAFQVNGDSMSGDDIQHGDYVIVDPDQPPAPGDIGVFAIRTERGHFHMTLNRLSRTEAGVSLLSSNPAHEPIIIGAEDDMFMVGKVVATVHPHSPEVPRRPV